MSDFAAFYIATVAAIFYAPWYVALPLGLALAWCFISELP